MMKPTAEEKFDAMPARIRAAVDEVVEARAAEAAVLCEENAKRQTAMTKEGG